MAHPVLALVLGAVRPRVGAVALLEPVRVLSDVGGPAVVRERAGAVALAVKPRALVHRTVRVLHCALTGVVVPDPNENVAWKSPKHLQM